MRTTADAPAPAAPPVDPGRPLDGLDLRGWQVEAFASWAAADCRGVVEAVTGTGKTRLAIAAVRACLARGGRALVLVPTLDLMDQWIERVRTHVPDARLGRLGGGHDDDIHDHHVVISTPHSAAPLPIEPPGGTVGLLVADEAHRYGAPTWGDALKPSFAMRLALTATYERNDDGIVEVLGPYFGGVVCQYGYHEAAADGVIAPFSVAFAGVTLTDDEQAAYAAADRRMRERRSRLVDAGLPRPPLEMIAAASRLVAGAEGTPQREARGVVVAARGFLSALRARRDVAAQASAKIALAGRIAPALEGRRSLVFTDTVAQAEAAAAAIAAAGPPAEELHGGLADDRRRIRLAQFRNGALSCLVAPRVLDEGLDVPDADVAVVLSAFRTRRQMIQRLGRVLRRTDDDREARLLVVHAAGTREDPADGAHEDFLAEVVGVAREVVHLDVADDPGAAARWLRS